MTYYPTGLVLLYGPNTRKNKIHIVIPDIITCDAYQLKEALVALEKVERVIREVYISDVTTLPGD